jgi:hypothetical protein
VTSMKSGLQVDDIYLIRDRYPLRIQDLKLQFIKNGTYPATRLTLLMVAKI